MRAITRDLDPSEPVDLVGFAGDDDEGMVWLQGEGGLATRGCAMRIDLPGGLAADGVAPHVAHALASIETDDEVARPATGPVAIGALPFDREAPGTFVVPQVLVGRSRDGRQWITTIDTDAPPLPPSSPHDHASLPDGFALSSPQSHDEFRQLVRDAVKAIESGDLDKVVIARDVVVETNRPIVVPAVLERLHALYPSCTVFSVDGFVGASPELLVERRGNRVRAFPLAGTFPRSGDPEADAVLAARLQASRKDREEHRYVIEDLRRALEARCDELVVADTSVVPLRNVLHLGTEITGHLRDEPAHALELVAALHPTPAVAGTPTAAALQWLADNEPLDRGHYAGPVGWIDGRGDGSFVVGIRSAALDQARTQARLFAGVGIVAGSDPESELVETQLKLQALLAAVVRP